MELRVQKATWAEYRTRVLDYVRRTGPHDRSLIFRGQARNDWRLVSSLDRVQVFSSAEERQKAVDDMVAEYWSLAAGLDEPEAARSPGLQNEILARHYGLRTTLLDWTFSPYIAAFFAFWDDQDAGEVSHASVWMMQRMRTTEVASVEIIDGDASSPPSVRRIEQQGLFVRLRSKDRFLDAVVPDALVRIDLPRSERRIILADLERMNITGRSMYRSLEALARDVSIRRLQGGSA